MTEEDWEKGGDDWEASARHVAGRIREIRATWLAEQVPQVEDVFDAGNGLYDVRTVISDPSKLIESIENRVRFALDLAVESNSCDLNEMSTAAKVLRHALDDCLDDPNALEQFLRQASNLIKGRVADGFFGEDEELSLLVLTLDELALQLRADHPAVSAAVDARTVRRFKEIDEQQRLERAVLVEDLREGATGRLAAEFGLASDTLRDGTSDQANADALKQSGNRAGKISLAERAKQTEGSGSMSALKIGLRADAVVEFVTRLFAGD